MDVKKISSRLDSGSSTGYCSANNLPICLKIGYFVGNCCINKANFGLIPLPFQMQNLAQPFRELRVLNSYDLMPKSFHLHEIFFWDMLEVKLIICCSSTPAISVFQKSSPSNHLRTYSADYYFGYKIGNFCISKTIVRFIPLPSHGQNLAYNCSLLKVSKSYTTLDANIL